MNYENIIIIEFDLTKSKLTIISPPHLTVLYSSIQAGEPRQCFHPWPPVNLRGGGAVIPCQYNNRMGNNMTEAIVESTMAKVKNSIALMPEKSVLIVTIV